MAVSHTRYLPVGLSGWNAPNATMLLTEGPLEEQAKYLIPDAPFVEPPDETQLLPLGDGLLQTPLGEASSGSEIVL
jgi:hypothetical protein